MARLAIAFDLDKCLGCHACVVACKQENHLPSGSSRNKVIRIGPTAIDSGHETAHIEMYYMPLLCQHCENPICVQVCPTGAAIQRQDGVVVIEKSRCIGCQFCVAACPYGQCYFDNEVVEKCTLCVTSLERGQKPACAKACMAECISFGDLNDPDSEITKIVREAGDNTHIFGDKDNKPAARYIQHNKRLL